MKKMFSSRGDEPDNPYPGRQQQQQQQQPQHHQEENEDQGVEESKGEDDQGERLVVETPGLGYGGNASRINTSTNSSGRRPMLATNNNNNAPRRYERGISSAEIEADETNPTGKQDTQRSRNPRVATTPGSSTSS
ncbi:unnamed protein product, partial [Ascophyllum nodosum]